VSEVGSLLDCLEQLDKIEQITMEQIMEFLKANKAESEAVRKADKEESMAKMERLLANQHETKANQERTNANLAEMKATIRSQAVSIRQRSGCS
jgi:hypothetical protein